MTRTCLDCPAPISTRSTGRCRACTINIVREETNKRNRMRASGGHKPAKLPQIHRDDTAAGRAADFLRHYGPLTRCNEQGFYDPKGGCWRRGSAILSASDVMERAHRLGFNPDSWREVRAA